MVDSTNDSTVQELEQKLAEAETARDKYLEELKKASKSIQRLSSAYSMLLQSITLAVISDE